MVCLFWSLQFYLVTSILITIKSAGFREKLEQGDGPLMKGINDKRSAFPYTWAFSEVRS